MTDRELLELAAKAAGFNFKWFKVKQWKNMKSNVGPCRYFTGTVDVYGSHHTKPWGPLTDDGDALRLAGHLGLIVDFSRFAAIEADRFYQGHRDFALGNNVREAITRAAASIVKDIQ